jgi:hypothetical protein
MNLLFRLLKKIYEGVKRMFISGSEVTPGATKDAASPQSAIKINSSFWYKDDHITAILKSYLKQANLHITTAEQGLILTAEDKLHVITSCGEQYSISLASPLVTGTTQSWKEGLLEKFFDVVKEVMAWNTAHLKGDASQIITKHAIVCPYDINNGHWTALVVNINILQIAEQFHLDHKIEVACFDSMNVPRDCSRIIKPLLERFKALLPQGLQQQAFNVDYFNPIVKAQPDACSCGVVTTENIRRVIFSEPPNIIMEPKSTPASQKQYFSDEILALRQSHISIWPELASIQISNGGSTADKVRAGTYAMPEKQLQDAADIPYILHTALPTDEAELAVVYAYIEAFCDAFKILEVLNQGEYDIAPDNKLFVFYSEKYSTEYAAHKANYAQKFNEELQDTNFAILYFCVDCACRSNLESLKQWCRSRHETLAPIWSSLFSSSPETVDLSWADNGKDKFADALKIILDAKKTGSIPHKKPDPLPEILHLYSKSQDSAVTNRRSDKQPNNGFKQVAIHNYVAELLLSLKFNGEVNQDDEPQTGSINCLLGDGFKHEADQYHVVYVGRLYKGRPASYALFQLFKMGDMINPDEKIIISCQIYPDGTISINTSTKKDQGFLSAFETYFSISTGNYRFELQNMSLAQQSSMQQLQTFEFKFKGEEKDGMPWFGFISCIVGQPFSESEFVCYSGQIDQGSICGIGTVFLYAGAVKHYISANFLYNADTKELSIVDLRTDITDPQLLNRLQQYIIENSRDLRLTFDAKPAAVSSSVSPSNVPVVTRDVPDEPDILEVKFSVDSPTKGLHPAFFP